MEIVLPPGKKLLPFQVEAVTKALKFLESPIHGCYNACEMRLGKTIQTIACINSILVTMLQPKYLNVLVLCPSIMQYVWEKEISSWFHPPNPYITHPVVLDKGSKFSQCTMVGFIITTYGLAASKKNLEKLLKTKWDFLILDEAHYVKNQFAKRTQAVLGSKSVPNSLWAASKYHIALSGTPFTKNCIDGFTLFHKFAPEYFKDFYSYAYRYTNVRRTPFGDQFKGIKNWEELGKIIKSKFFFRYKMRDVVEDLPDRVFQEIELDDKQFRFKLTPDEKKAQEAYHAKLIEFMQDKRAFPPTPPVAVATQRRKQGLLKVKPIVELCKEYLDAGIPIVLFLIHTDVIEKIKHELRKYKPIVIQGSTSAVDRESFVSAFQSGQSDLFIGQIHAAGIGVTLHRSSTVVIGEPDYSPSVLAQGIARVDEVGKKTSITIIYFVVRNSIDSKVVKLLMSKVADFEKVLDGKSAAAKRIKSP